MKRHPRKEYGILSPRDNVHFYYEDKLLRCDLGFHQKASQINWILSESKPWILLQYDANFYVEYIEVYYWDKETLVTDDIDDKRAIVYYPQTDSLSLYDKNGDLLENGIMSAELNELYNYLIQFSIRNMRWISRNFLTRKINNAFANYLKKGNKL